MPLPFDEFMEVCRRNGYTHPTVLPDGRQAIVYARLYNTQILVGLDLSGYDDSY